MCVLPAERTLRWLGAGCLLTCAATLHAADAPAKSTAEYRQAMRQLLEVADERTPTSAALAQRRFQAARAIAPDARPVQYAYGVVLQRLNKSKDASAQFAEAGKSPAGGYPPAYEAWVTTLFAARQWSAVAHALQSYGETLVNRPESWKEPKERGSSAEWLGRAVSAAILVAPQGADVQRFADVDSQLRDVLPTDVSTDYVRGFEEVIQLHEQLAESGEKARRDAKETQEKERETERGRVAEQQGKVTSQREDLKLTAEEWKKRLDDKQADFSKQLGLLEKDWTARDQKRLSIERSILLAQQESTALTQQYQLLASERRPSTADRLRMQQIDFQLNQRQQQLFDYQLQRDQTVVAMQAVYRQAAGVLAQRQAFIADYERATGQLVKQDDSLRKWNDRLAKQKTELEETPTGKTPGTQALEQKMKSIGTYLPADWEAIRQRLLAEYGAP
jgi:hypothetical protein